MKSVVCDFFSVVIILLICFNTSAQEAGLQSDEYAFDTIVQLNKATICDTNLLSIMDNMIYHEINCSDYDTNYCIVVTVYQWMLYDSTLNDDNLYYIHIEFSDKRTILYPDYTFFCLHRDFLCFMRIHGEFPDFFMVNDAIRSFHCIIRWDDLFEDDHFSRWAIAYHNNEFIILDKFLCK